MKTSLCLGLVGGLGVGATIHYYRELTKAHEAQGRTLDLVMAHAETPRVFEYVQANDRDGLAEYLNGYIRRMKAAGAEVAAIPAVTPHFCVRELIASSPLSVCNIFEPLARELVKRATRRVSVFGTRFVMESALFGELNHQVEVVRSTPQEEEFIHNTYVELARTGKASPQLHREMSALARTIVSRDDVDAIIFAGTDLSLLFNESNTDFPYVDCAKLHVEAILAEVLTDRSST